MVRDFTEATKERLLNEIDDINKTTWSPVTDALGDFYLRAKKFIGLLSLNEDMSNVESYQRQVLDMTNMTKKELQKIFEDVYGLDKQFNGYIQNLNKYEDVFNERLKALYGMIQPNFSICDAKTIKSMGNGYNDKLKVIAGKINKDFDKEMDWASRQAALEATKGIVGGLINGIVDVVTAPVSMIKNVVTGNWKGIFTDTWSLVDDVFSVGSNAVSLATLGLGYGLSACTNNKSMRNEAIGLAESYAGNKGLTDVLETEEKVNGKSVVLSGMKTVSKAADTASAGFGLYDGAKGFLKDPSSMIDIKGGFKTKLKTVKKADMLTKYQDDYRHWQSLYRGIGKTNHYVALKNVSNGYKYLENLWNVSDGWESVTEGAVKTGINSTNKWFKSWGDAYDLGEDIVDFI